MDSNEDCSEFDLNFSPDNLINPIFLSNDVYTIPSHLLNSKDKLSLLHINCCSLLRKVHDVELLVKLCGANIIALTGLDANTENYVSVKDYKFISKSGMVSRGGGVGFLLLEDISFQVIDPISINISVTSFEFLLLKIPQRKCSDIFVGVVYRHPDCNLNLFNVEFFNLLNYF